MRISFSCVDAARAAVSLLATFGFHAVQAGPDVVTDCPALLAAPAIEHAIGFEQVERIDLKSSDTGAGLAEASDHAVATVVRQRGGV